MHLHPHQWIHLLWCMCTVVRVRGLGSHEVDSVYALAEGIANMPEMAGEDEAYLGHDMFQVPHRPQDRFARKETNIDQHHRKPHPVLMVVRALATPLRSSQGSPGQELLGSGDAPRCRTVAARILERGCCDPNSDRVAP